MRTRGSLEVHLVTRGCGYPGYHLGKKLVENGHKVILFDLIQLEWPLLDGMTVIQVHFYIWTRPCHFMVYCILIECLMHACSGISMRTYTIVKTNLQEIYFDMKNIELMCDITKITMENRVLHVTVNIFTEIVSYFETISLKVWQLYFVHGEHHTWPTGRFHLTLNLFHESMVTVLFLRYWKQKTRCLWCMR